MPRTDAKPNLPRLAIDSNPYKYQQYQPSPTSSISSTKASIAPSFDTPCSGVFYVLCLHDLETIEPEQLSFKKNDVLEIVKQEESVSCFTYTFSRIFPLMMMCGRAGGQQFVMMIG